MPVCGLTYVRESAADRAPLVRVRRQLLFHWRPAATEEVLARVGDLKIVMVRPLAAGWMRKRVARIARRAHLDADYDFIPYDGTAAECTEFASHAFVGVIGGQAVRPGIPAPLRLSGGSGRLIEDLAKLRS